MSTEGDPDGDTKFLLIRNETVDGKKFRPSDWADRLQSTLSCLGEEEFGRCIDLVQIVNDGGGKCVLVNTALEQSEPRLYRFLMRFCQENRLATETRITESSRRKDESQKSADTFRRALSF